MKIGYQGILGSNSYKAAQLLVKQANLQSVEYVGLVTSKDVVEALETDEVDYGVLAISNSSAGEVIETKEALQDKTYQICETYSLVISHCLYAKHARLEDITTVASHIQALKQCEQTIRRLISHVKFQEEKDTALSAIMLSEGTLSEEVAVICTEEAGKANGLELLQKDVQDNANNTTNFILISR